MIEENIEETIFFLLEYNEKLNIEIERRLRRQFWIDEKEYFRFKGTQPLKKTHLC